LGVAVSCTAPALGVVIASWERREVRPLDAQVGEETEARTAPSSDRLSPLRVLQVRLSMI